MIGVWWMDIAMPPVSPAAWRSTARSHWRKNLDDRRDGMAMFTADLASTGQLRPDHTVDTAADVLWLAMDVRNYRPMKAGWRQSARP